MHRQSDVWMRGGGGLRVGGQVVVRIEGWAVYPQLVHVDLAGQSLNGAIERPTEAQAYE